MKTRTLAAIAATALLALTACSSDKDDNPGGDNPGGNPDTPAFSGGFCDASNALDSLGAASDAAQNEVDALLENSTDPNDPAVIAAIQAFGEIALGEAEEAIGILEGAKADVSDPEVDAALDTMIGLYESFMVPIAEAAIGATDSFSYAMVALELMSDENISAILDDASSAGTILSDYESANCS